MSSVRYLACSSIAHAAKPATFRIRRLVFCLLLVLCGLAPELNTNTNAGASIAAKALQEDLQTLMGTIERVHPDMYAYTDKDSVKKRIEEALRRLDRPMTSLEFYKRVTPLVSALESGHTYVALPQWDEHLKTDGRFYPLEILWHGEEVILAPYYGRESLPLGGTVLSINGQPATELLLRLSRYLSAEGQEGNRYELERPAVLQQVLWSEFQNAELRLEIRDPEGCTSESLIRPITLAHAAKEKMPHHGEGLFSCRYLEECRTALLRIESFGLKDGSDFRRFLARTFEDTGPTDNLHHHRFAR